MPHEGRPHDFIGFPKERPMSHANVRSVRVDGKSYAIDKNGRIVGGPFDTDTAADFWIRQRSQMSPREWGERRSPALELGDLAGAMEEGYKPREFGEGLEPSPSDYGPLTPGAPGELKYDPKNVTYTAQAPLDPMARRSGEFMADWDTRREKQEKELESRERRSGESTADWFKRLQQTLPANLPKVDPWARRPEEPIEEWLNRLQRK